MDKEQVFKLVDMMRDQERSLRVPVYIPHDEENRIVVNRLIAIRNSKVNARKDMSHFDKVLKHFLSEDEFNVHVVNNLNFEHNGDDNG